MVTDNPEQRCRNRTDLCRYDLHQTCLAFNMQKDQVPVDRDETGRVFVDRCPMFKGVYAQKLETFRAALAPLLAEHLPEQVEKQLFSVLVWTKHEQERLNTRR